MCLATLVLDPPLSERSDPFRDVIELVISETGITARSLFGEEADYPGYAVERIDFSAGRVVLKRKAPHDP